MTKYDVQIAATYTEAYTKTSEVLDPGYHWYSVEADDPSQAGALVTKWALERGDIEHVVVTQVSACSQ